MTLVKPLVIGITGGSGSGKTTVSRQLLERLADKSALLLQQDAYYNDQAEMTMTQRFAVNYDHPDAFDMTLMFNDLTKLLHYEAIEKPVYDYENYTRRTDETDHQEPADIVIVEGLFLFNDVKMRELIDIRVFVDTDDDIRFLRRLERDIEERGRTVRSVIDQYLATVKPMYHQFIEPTKRYANIVVPEGGNNRVAIDMLTNQARAILRKG